MVQDEIFPSEYACFLGEQCGLLEVHGEKMDYDKYIQRNFMMRHFQQMAMSNDFKDCVVVFCDTKINKKQRKILKRIHGHTRPFAYSDNTAILMKKLRSPLCSGKEARELAESIRENINGETETNILSKAALNSGVGLKVFVTGV